MKNTSSKLSYLFLLLFLLCSFLFFSISKYADIQHGEIEPGVKMNSDIDGLLSNRENSLESDSVDLMDKAILCLVKSDSLSVSGQHHLSIEMAREAMALFDRLNAWEYYMAAEGVVARNYVQLGDFEQVASINQKMKELVMEKKLPLDSYIQLHFLSGTIYHEKGLYTEAVQEFDLALDILNGDLILRPIQKFSDADSVALIGKRLMLAHTYNYAAFSIIALGDFDKGLDYFKKAKNYYELVEDHGNVFSSFINIGSVYLKKNAADEAIPYFNDLVEQLQGIPSGIPVLAIVYKHLIECYELKGDYQQQKIYIDQLINLFTTPEIALLQSITGVLQDVAYASVLADEALNQALRGEHKQAVESAQYVLEIIENTHHNIDLVSSIYNRVGTTFYMAGEMEKALHSYQRGLAALTPDLEETNYLKNPVTSDFLHKLRGVELLAKKAKVLFHWSDFVDPTKQLQYLQTALATAELSAELFEQIQRNLVQASLDQVSREGSLLDLEQRFNEIFDLNMAIAYALYQKTKETKYINKAFQISEKSKAYILRQAMDKVERFKDFPTEQRKALQDLEAELFFFEKEIIKAERSGNQEKKNTLELQQIDLKETYQQLVSQMKSNPATAQYYADQYEPRLASIPEVQQLLTADSGKALLQIYEANDKIYSFFITANNCEIQCKEKPNDWETQIDRLRSLNLDLNLIADEELMEEYLAINENITENLFPDQWNNKNKKINRLVIIPHGHSHEINFNLLLRSFAPPVFHRIAGIRYPVADCSTFDYLAKSYAVAYAHSAAILLDDAAKAEYPVAFDYSLMGFAPDYTYRNNNRIISDPFPLDSLPDELTPVLPLFAQESVKILSGEVADEAAFREMVASYSANILHISAHAEIDEEGALLSRIQLAKSPNNNNTFDDDLQVAELYSLQINTELAILSACSSGAGERMGGSAKISLARGFAYANCPGILMSLWDLEIEANQVIMKELYTQLIKYRQSVDQSLQKAQLHYLAQRQIEWKESEGKSPKERERILESMHPFFWGGLVPIGRTDALSLGAARTMD